MTANDSQKLPSSCGDCASALTSWTATPKAWLQGAQRAQPQPASTHHHVAQDVKTRSDWLRINPAHRAGQFERANASVSAKENNMQCRIIATGEIKHFANNDSTAQTLIQAGVLEHIQSDPANGRRTGTAQCFQMEPTQNRNGQVGLLSLICSSTPA